MADTGDTMAVGDGGSALEGTATVQSAADQAADPAASGGAGGRKLLRGLGLPVPRLSGLQALAGRVPASKVPSLKLPALKLPALKLARPQLRRPQFDLPRPGRPALADMAFSLGAASLVFSVLVVVVEPVRARLQARTDLTTITANAATLQLAAETYAAGNGGRYARDAQDLLPYLPGGAAPRNPYTGEPALFRGLAGDLTYRPVSGGGYVIEAWGRGAAKPVRLATLRGGSTAAAH